MRWRVSIVACLVAGSLSMPTSAPSQGFTEVESGRALYSHAYCAVRNDLPDAKKLFTTPPGSKEEAKLLRSLNVEVCGLFGNGLPALEADHQLIRGVIAEAVYDQSGKNKAHVDPAVAPFGNLSADAMAALDAKGRASLVGLDFAQCVVAASPDGVKALLNSSFVTGEQDKVLGQLQPYFAPCLPRGAQITFSKLMLRGLFAEAAYRSLYFTTAAGKK
jgi:hypothetical protein